MFSIGVRWKWLEMKIIITELNSILVTAEENMYYHEDKAIETNSKFLID